MMWDTVKVRADGFREAARRVAAVLGRPVEPGDLAVRSSGCRECGCHTFAYDDLPKPKPLPEIPVELLRMD